MRFSSIKPHRLWLSSSSKILEKTKFNLKKPQNWNMGLRILKLWGQGCQPYLKIAGAITFKGMRNVKGFFQNSFFDYEDGSEGNYVKGIPRDSYGSRNGERRGLVQVPRTRSIPLQIATMWNTDIFTCFGVSLIIFEL